MTAYSYANMASGHGTYRSGPQGAAVKSPTSAASSSLSTTSYSGARKAAAAKLKSSGKVKKKK
jgi:hypothetical protein